MIHLPTGIFLGDINAEYKARSLAFAAAKERTGWSNFDILVKTFFESESDCKEWIVDGTIILYMLKL